MAQLAPPLSQGVSAQAFFDKDGNLMLIRPVVNISIDYRVDGSPPVTDQEPLDGLLIYEQSPQSQQNISFRGADTGPEPSGDDCYIISINATIPGGALWRAEKLPPNRKTIQGRGTWLPNGRPPVTNDISGAYDSLLQLQQEIVSKVGALNPSTKFKQVFIPPPDKDVVSTCYVLERTNSVDDPEDPNFEPIERAGVVVTLAMNRPVPSQATQNVVRGPSGTNAGIFVPSDGSYFNAAHLSVMVHPRNPHAPICHSSFRQFEIMQHSGDASKATQKHWAHGGAVNLMPTVLLEENEHVYKDFHRSLRTIVEPYGKNNFYGSMKKACDNYFRDQHHGEGLGVGGIFFDNLGPDENPQLGPKGERPTTKVECRNFVRAITNGWSDVFLERVKVLSKQPWNHEDRDFQLRQRGRIIDYLLAQDMGFRFGLATKSGSLAAMRLVLPGLAKWSHEPATSLSDGAAHLLEILKNEPKDWANE